MFDASRRWKTVLLAITIPLILFLILFIKTERRFRNEYYYPGVFIKDFKKVDSLVPEGRDIVDEDGIQKANPEYWNVPWWEEKGYHVNEEGFRSRSFMPDSLKDSTAISILFLGDSHTWGGSARPITKSFVDLIDSMGYVTFNTGIHNSDPAQFLAICKKYLPLLKPDLCILVHYSGNQPMMFKRDPKPFVPMYYQTNAGMIDAWKAEWLPNAEQEHFNSALDAYNFFIDNYTLYGEDVTFWGKLFRRTVVTTWLYKRLTGIKLPNSNIKWPKHPVTDYYIDQIDSICQINGTVFKIFILLEPYSVGDDLSTFREDYPDIFVDYEVCLAENITLEDYAPGEYHLNNKGNKKLANYIIQKINSEGFKLK